MAATRGVAHPPGYPTWTLLASTLVDLVPWGTAAWRTSLFSALATAAAAAMAFAALRGLGCRRSVALAFAVWLGVLPSVWRLSTVAEVYALNLFFVAAIVACLAAASASLARAGSPRRAIVAVEGPDRCRVAVLGLQPPDEPRTPVRQRIDRIELRAESFHPGIVNRCDEAADIHLCQMKPCHATSPFPPREIMHARTTASP